MTRNHFYENVTKAGGMEGSRLYDDEFFLEDW